MGNYEVVDIVELPKIDRGNINTKLNNLSDDGESIEVIKKLELQFQNQYVFDLAVDKKKSPHLYYITYHDKNSNLLLSINIGFTIKQLKEIAPIIGEGLKFNAIMGKNELTQYGEAGKFEIGNFIREVTGQDFNDIFYRPPLDKYPSTQERKKNIFLLNGFIFNGDEFIYKGETVVNLIKFDPIIQKEGESHYTPLGTLYDKNKVLGFLRAIASGKIGVVEIKKLTIQDIQNNNFISSLDKKIQEINKKKIQLEQEIKRVQKDEIEIQKKIQEINKSKKEIDKKNTVGFDFSTTILYIQYLFNINNLTDKKTELTDIINSKTKAKQILETELSQLERFKDQFTEDGKVKFGDFKIKLISFYEIIHKNQ